MNVMLIDDDRECLESLGTALRLNGFNVQSFDSPDQAIRRYNPQKVDVVISDYHLPGMKGTEFLKKTNAPVIIVTGDPKKNIKKLSLQAGACAFFTKPVNIKKIIAKIKQLSRH